MKSLKNKNRKTLLAKEKNKGEEEKASGKMVKASQNWQKRKIN